MNPDTTAIVFQGLQVDFCNPGGKLYDQLAEQLTSRRLVAAVTDFLRDALDLGLRAYFVPIIFTPDYRELCQVGGILAAIKEVGAFQAGTRGAEPVDELRPLLDRVTVVGAKRGLCGFGSTDLDDRLRSDGIKTIAVCGLLTNVCVETTARSAYDLGYEVIMLTDLTAAKSAEEQAASERFIFPLLGRSITAREFLKEVSGAQEATQLPAAPQSL